jgi:uncharacterized alkaline shock family protein YloU
METEFPQLEETTPIHQSGLGKVEIAPEVIEVIAGLATTEIEGVAYMSGGFVGGIVEKLGRKNLSKGVRVELGEAHTVIDLSIVVDYGVCIPEVAKSVQENVKSTIYNMTGLEVIEVNVHIINVQIKHDSKLGEDDK